MSTGSPAPRDRRAPEERRAQLLDAANSAIGVRGFDGVSVRDVAKQANVSTGLLHHYFDSFHAMLAEAFAHEARNDIDRIAAATAALASPLERLDRLVAMYAPRADDPGWFIWFSAWSAAPRQPQLRQTVERLHAEWTRQFEEVLTDGADAGIFRCPEPAGATRRIVSLMDGLATQVVALESVHASDVARDIAIATAAETGLMPEDFPEIRAIGTGPVVR
jgi:AcrR family transcriptional regulator